MTLLEAGPVAVVTVVGALELTQVPRVRVALEEALDAGPAHVVVDLAACDFVDASALSMLLVAHRSAARQGGVLTLRGCSPRVLRLLSLTGLTGVFDLAE